jgi:hypothetical protein
MKGTQGKATIFKRGEQLSLFETWDDVHSGAWIRIVCKGTATVKLLSPRSTEKFGFLMKQFRKTRSCSVGHHVGNCFSQTH